ncbi:MAG: hypothetical protein F4Y08_13325 [Caldilineaceae bacterium SB0662_bin_9]|uniref:Uncharacterized protein n=1 Tax=Caldilineaceae bacterium SB0662_bin_9 TaxID=2605258 RepID=A0A6B1DWC4_9CHLR|nr:hypothetical protein [Caldilineaceae bacterium SB0662_bin_9]
MGDLHIKISRSTLDEGSVLERAAFGRLEVSTGNRLLTLFLDRDEIDPSSQLSTGPFVSGYHLAEWFAIHWWRLRWEPGSRYVNSSTYTWDLSHRMSDIGGGYLWPNIVFDCDGYLFEVVSSKTIDELAPIEYLGSDAVHVPASVWEDAIDCFVTDVLSRLDEANLHDTELHAIWHELSEERSDAALTSFRRTEALLGFDVDEGNEAHIEAVLSDTNELGIDAVNELATGTGGTRTSASDIRSVSETAGFAADPKDGVSLSPTDLPDVLQWGQVAAWRIGKQLAHFVRNQTGLSDGPVNNQVLAGLAGTSPCAVENHEVSGPFTWVFAPGDTQGRIVLRSNWLTSRRFDMARVVGDRVFSMTSCVSAEPLSPATSSYSYRQKAQRSFAAELLCPWHAIEDDFEEGFDDAVIERVAAQFQVSERVVENQLDNNQRYG